MLVQSVIPTIQNSVTNLSPCQNSSNASPLCGRSVNMQKEVSSNDSSPSLGKIFKTVLLLGTLLNSASAFQMSPLRRNSASISANIEMGNRPGICRIEMPFYFESICKIDDVQPSHESDRALHSAPYSVLKDPALKGPVSAKEDETRKQTSRSTKPPKAKQNKTPQNTRNNYEIKRQLRDAIISGKISEIRKLHLNGVDLNQPLIEGMNCIQMASAHNFPMAIQVLVEAGADVNYADERGLTGLHHAVISGALASAEMLISLGADLNTLSTDGMSPLHFAAFSNKNIAVLIALIEAGANVDLPTKAHLTPLHLAGGTLNKEFIKILQAAGANNKLFDLQGRTPLLFCRYNHNFDACTKVLGDNGASDEVFDEFNLIVYLSHVWEMKGHAVLRGQNIPLEGSNDFHDFENHIGKSLMRCSVANPGFLSPDEADRLSSILQSTGSVTSKEPLKQMVTDLKKGRPIYHHIGYEEHRAILTIIGDYMMIADKGGASPIPLKVFKIDREHIDNTALQEMIEIKKTASDYTKWIESIEDRFKASHDPLTEFLEKQYPYLTFQMVGNCAYESIETALCPLFSLNRLGSDLSTVIEGDSLSENALKKLDAALKSYQIWVQFNRLDALETYLSKFKPNDSQTPWIDRRLVMNVFLRAWLNTEWHQINREKLERIENEYMENMSNGKKREFLTLKLTITGDREKFKKIHPEKAHLFNQL